jgi:hypothetical protein
VGREDTLDFGLKEEDRHLDFWASHTVIRITKSVERVCTVSGPKGQ